MGTEISSHKILLVEDDAQDVKMTLTALQEIHLAHEVAVVRDGAEALNYLYHRGNSKRDRTAIPSWYCLTTRCRRSADWKY